MPHQENKNVALSYTMPFNGKLDSAGTDVSQRLIHKAMNQTGQRLFILWDILFWRRKQLILNNDKACLTMKTNSGYIVIELWVVEYSSYTFMVQKHSPSSYANKN